MNLTELMYQTPFDVLCSMEPGACKIIENHFDRILMEDGITWREICRMDREDVSI